MLLSEHAFWLNSIAITSLIISILSAMYIMLDQVKSPKQDMPVMTYVWILTGLWAGIIGVVLYICFGKTKTPKTDMKMDMPNMDMNMKSDMKPDMNMDMPNMENMTMGMSSDMKMNMPDMDMNMKPDMNMDMDMDMKSSSPFWQKVTVGTLHCGAGCSLADLMGAWIFRAFPFMFLGSYLFGEWLFEYFLALAIGVAFQYAGLYSMLKIRGIPLIWRAFKVDVLSLSAWQVGMYIWMAIANFVLIGNMTPFEPIFWFMMQIAMFFGFITAYPMNWYLIKSGIKTAM